MNFYLYKGVMDSFEHMYKIFKIYLSIPTISASFSLYIVSLTFIRNTIGQQRSTNVVILHIEKIY